MMFWIRLATREIRNNRRFSLFFIINLSIGLVGFITLNSFNHALNDHFQTNLKTMLTADFTLTSSEEIKPAIETSLDELLGPERIESRQIRFYSMVASEKNAKLAEIVAMDKNYPLYGQILLDHQETSYPDLIQAELVEEDGAWLSEDTAISLGAEEGDPLKIGQKRFLIKNLVSGDPDSSLTSMELAPRIYISLDKIEETGLIRFGSRVQHIRYYRYPEGTDVDAIVERLNVYASEAKDNEPLFRVVDTKRVGQRLGRIVDNFTGYMGLIAIIALFLAGVGAAYLFRSYLNRNTREIAILMSLGATRYESYLLFLIQIVSLGLIASVLSTILSVSLLPIFPILLKGIIPPSLSVTTDISSLLTALVLGTVGSVIFCLPVLGKIHFLKPSSLLRGPNDSNGSRKNQALVQILMFVPILVLFWGLSVSQIDSIQRASVFLGGFIAAVLAISLFGLIFFSLFKLASSTKRMVLKIALRNLYRNKFSSLSCFLTIAMGAFLINLVPQLKNGIETEIHRPEGFKIPGFFLFDIQPDQARPLKTFLSERQIQITKLSPMVQGRITRINQIDYGEWRNRVDDDPGEERRRSGPREARLSYPMDGNDDETIVAGTAFTTDVYEYSQDVPAEISISQGYAEWLRINIGDRIDFSIQGIPITGQVVNFREVTWNSFQPNFSILFQKGVLEEAPQTFLASLPQMKDAKKREFQNELVKRFPNISTVNISEAVEKVLDITDQLGFAINFMAYLSILAGLVVLFSIARYEARRRVWEINLLKVLGAGFKDVRDIIQIEFGLIAFSAALLALLFSLAASYGISYLYFDRLWAFQWRYGVLILTAITLISVITALLATRKTIREKPMAILQSE